MGAPFMASMSRCRIIIWHLGKKGTPQTGFPLFFLNHLTGHLPSTFWSRKRSSRACEREAEAEAFLLTRQLLPEFPAAQTLSRSTPINISFSQFIHPYFYGEKKLIFSLFLMMMIIALTFQKSMPKLTTSGLPNICKSISSSHIYHSIFHIQ